MKTVIMCTLLFLLKTSIALAGGDESGHNLVSPNANRAYPGHRNLTLGMNFYFYSADISDAGQDLLSAVQKKQFDGCISRVKMSYKKPERNPTGLFNARECIVSVDLISEGQNKIIVFSSALGGMAESTFDLINVPGRIVAYAQRDSECAFNTPLQDLWTQANEQSLWCK